MVRQQEEGGRWLGVALGLGGMVGGSWLVGRVLGFRGLPFALVTHVLLMRWALYVLRAVPNRPPRNWFRVRPWEPALYRRLGVFGYMKLLRRSGWERFRREAVGFDGRRGSLVAYERATREAEFSHLLLGGIGMGLVLGAFVRRAWGAAGWLLGANLFFQVYPVMLQRTMRARLQRLGVRPGRPSSWGRSHQGNVTCRARRHSSSKVP